MLSKKIECVGFLVSLVLLANCSKQKFSGGVTNAQIEAAKPIVDEMTTGEENAEETAQAPIVTTKPSTDKTFNECETFENAPIVADLYPVSEAKFYELGQKPLANLSYGAPAKTFCMTNLDIPMRNFSEGFPGYPDLKSWFILDINFSLNAPEAGTYTILMDSDDGSIVTVNEEELINVDGLRDGNMKIYEQQTVELKKGSNDVRVRYMQGPGPDLALQLKWMKPGDSTPAVIPSAFLAKPVRP